MRVLSENTDLSELPTVFRQFAPVEAVYVFGSAVTERRHAESDLDLGVEGDPGELESHRLEMLTELARRGFCRVDLVLLRKAPPALAHEMVKHNQVVYARDDVDTGAIFSRVVRKYLDIVPYLRLQAAAYKARVLHDQA